MFAFALTLAAIAFVSLDDRPVTLQLPIMLGRIAGVTVEPPPRALLGTFLEPGRPDAIADWIGGSAARADANAFVVSADMLAYGGLIASRVPGPSYEEAAARLKSLAQLRAKHPRLWIAAFGTIMRLAPTEVGPGTKYFAAYPAWKNLLAYASLHDPPLPSEAARAAKLRASIGTATLQGYLSARARDLAVDRLLLRMTDDGTIDRLVIGQDDSGLVGLHENDVRRLRADLARASFASRVSIESGADELGLALVANALARGSKWMPRIAVRYSTASGAAFQDPLEYAPISSTIESSIEACGGVLNDARPDIALYVRVPNTSAAQDDTLVAAMTADLTAGRHVALADLSFLASYRDQAAFARRILASRLASKLDAYASWNTAANTVGTALAEAIAAGTGRRTGTYDDLAHRTFTFVRFLDDYAFHDMVRPRLNAALAARNIGDDTPLEPNLAKTLTDRERTLLSSYAGPLLAQLDPGYHIGAMSISLPWNRTFETAIDVRLAKDL